MFKPAMEPRLRQPTKTASKFNDRIKYWFLNKGILNKLEVFLRSQMVIEFQKSSGQLIKPETNPVISPKTQAVKLLIADFLLQQDLLFSLSVYFSEIPFLQNLTQFSQYITNLSELNENITYLPNKSKPKFSREDLTDIAEALNFNLNPEEVQFLYEIYTNGKFNSLLFCLLITIPKLIKKYRNSVIVLKKTRKKEKFYHKSYRTEKRRTKRMYCLLQDAYGVVDKHRSEIKEILRKQNDIETSATILASKLAELAKKETELMTWHRSLELKEGSLEKIYRYKMQEVLEKSKLLEKRDIELQDRFQCLNYEKEELRIEKERIEYRQQQIQATESNEAVKLQEFERKFQNLQEEVRDVLKTYTEKQKYKRSEETVNREMQTESEMFTSMKDHLSLMEKENSLLKLSSTKQRNFISHLTNEVGFLKSRLDYFEKEIKMRNTLKLENHHHRELIQKLEVLGYRSRRQEVNSLSRRKLFGEEVVNYKSSSNSKDTDLTDEIVADAKIKVKRLEDESEALDRNSKNLLDIMNRNIAFSENRVFDSTSYSESSPSHRTSRIYQFSRSYSDTSSNMSPDPKGSTLLSNLDAKYSESASDSPQSPRLQWNMFHGMLMKHRRDQNRKKHVGSENVAISSIPRNSQNAEICSQIEEKEKGIENVNIIIKEPETDGEGRDLTIENQRNLRTDEDLNLKSQIDFNLEYKNIQKRQISSDSVESEDKVEISAGSTNSKSSDFWK